MLRGDGGGDCHLGSTQFAQPACHVCSPSATVRHLSPVGLCLGRVAATRLLTKCCATHGIHPLQQPLTFPAVATLCSRLRCRHRYQLYRLSAPCHLRYKERDEVGQFCPNGAASALILVSSRDCSSPVPLCDKLISMCERPVAPGNTAVVHDAASKPNMSRPLSRRRNGGALKPWWRR